MFSFNSNKKAIHLKIGVFAHDKEVNRASFFVFLHFECLKSREMKEKKKRKQKLSFLIKNSLKGNLTSIHALSNIYSH